MGYGRANLFKNQEENHGDIADKRLLYYVLDMSP